MYESTGDYLLFYIEGDGKVRAAIQDGQSETMIREPFYYRKLNWGEQMYFGGKRIGKLTFHQHNENPIIARNTAEMYASLTNYNLNKFISILILHTIFISNNKKVVKQS